MFIYSQMYKFHLLPSYREKNLSKYCSQSLTDKKRGAGRALKKNLCSVANTRYKVVFASLLFFEGCALCCIVSLVVIILTVTLNQSNYRLQILIIISNAYICTIIPSEVGSAIFLGGALSLECYLFFYVR
jgi:hypothetical protein